MNMLKSLKEKYHSIEKITQNLNSNNNKMELDLQINDNNNESINNNWKEKKFEFVYKTKSKRNYIEMKNNQLNEQTNNESHNKKIIGNIDNINISIHNNNFFLLNNSEKNINADNYEVCFLKKKFLKFK